MVEQIASRIQKMCLGFPGAEEVMQFGHPFYKVGGKPFAILSGHDGLSLSVKVEKAVQGVFLEDPRFAKTPYIGRHGWVSLHLGAKVDWDEVKGLIEGSFGFVLPKPQKAKKRQI